MTKPRFVMPTVESARGRMRFKMFRVSGNTGGQFDVSPLDAGSPLITTIDVTKYTTGVWHQIDIPIDAADAISTLAMLDFYIDRGTHTAITGAPVWLSDIEFVYDNPGHVMWQKSASASYTLTLTDVGRHVYISTGGINVPSDANLSGWPVGGQCEIINNSGSNQTIVQGAGNTMYLAGTATTGNRNIAQRGRARLIKTATNEWICDGTGVT